MSKRNLNYNLEQPKGRNVWVVVVDKVQGMSLGTYSSGMTLGASAGGSGSRKPG
jgi:hypothetical protein